MKNLFKHLFLLSIAIFIISCSGSGDKPVYQTITVKRKTINTSILATGIIKPKVGAEVKVGSRVSGSQR
jgi:multidrug efflux pump subunit AcrA (membrane-fusion protein)